MNKKGQLKIQEMAFVLLAVIFLFALVLLMFTSLMNRETQKIVIKQREARTITFLEVVSALPELRCSSSFSSTSEAVCVDKDKLAFFNSSPSMQEKYAILWRNALISKIEVQEVYPVSFPAPSYIVYSLANTQDISTRTYATYSALCSESDRGSICSIGKIKVTVIMPDKT
jgi:hypothetical protein